MSDQSKVRLKCSKCKVEFTVKAPGTAAQRTIYFTQVLIVMRQIARCPGCGAVYTPIVDPRIVQWILSPDRADDAEGDEKPWLVEPSGKPM